MPKTHQNSRKRDKFPVSNQKADSGSLAGWLDLPTFGYNLLFCPKLPLHLV
jgi:hypothetical protein